ncbi:MAG TPA: phage tail tape measure protein [Planctomycetota bacterium]|nr:phage tail tape measure protein [Planctomycetota bacterium]
MTDLGGAFQQFAQAIQQQIIRQLVTEPAGAAVGGWLASTFSPAGGAAPAASRLGNAFDGGIVPFAMGGVVSRPTMFAYGSGELGIMGEAGPEAVMPLRRGRDGRLGVEAARGGSPVVVNMRVTTPDPNAFRRSQGQLAARQAAAVRGAR